MTYKCIKCGKPARQTRYFVIDIPYLLPNAYSVCEEHKHLKYERTDFFDENGIRLKND